MHLDSFVVGFGYTAVERLGLHSDLLCIAPADKWKGLAIFFNGERGKPPQSCMVRAACGRHRATCAREGGAVWARGRKPGNPTPIWGQVSYCMRSENAIQSGLLATISS